jgi:hypothetical protein
VNHLLRSIYFTHPIRISSQFNSFCAARTSNSEKPTAFSQKDTTAFGRGAQRYEKALSCFSLISGGYTPSSKPTAYGRGSLLAKGKAY